REAKPRRRGVNFGRTGFRSRTAAGWVRKPVLRKTGLETRSTNDPNLRQPPRPSRPCDLHELPQDCLRGMLDALGRRELLCRLPEEEARGAPREELGLRVAVHAAVDRGAGGCGELDDGLVQRADRANVQRTLKLQD